MLVGGARGDAASRACLPVRRLEATGQYRIVVGESVKPYIGVARF